MAVRTFTFVEGELIHQYDGTNSHDILPDPHGNVVGLLGADSGIEFDFEYWPYEEVPSAFSAVTPYRYIGAQGYYSDIYSPVYVVARHYRAPYGRWMTVDPIWPRESAYGYVECNPLSLVDPDGMKPLGSTCYDLLKGGSLSDKDRAKLAKCVLDCLAGGSGQMACIAKCLIKLGKGVAKGVTIDYLCCLAYSRSKVTIKGETYWVDPCEDTQDLSCCNSRFCACVLDRPGRWEGIVDGVCPGKVVLKCQDAALKECDVDGYVAPPFDN